MKKEFHPEYIGALNHAQSLVSYVCLCVMSLVCYVFAGCSSLNGHLSFFWVNIPLKYSVKININFEVN